MGLQSNFHVVWHPCKDKWPVFWLWYLIIQLLIELYIIIFPATVEFNAVTPLLAEKTNNWHDISFFLNIKHAFTTYNVNLLMWNKIYFSFSLACLRGGNLIRNGPKRTIFSWHIQKILRMIQATVISLTPCRGFNGWNFFYNIFEKLYGWWCEIMRIFHGDGMLTLSPKSNNHETMNA